MHFSRIAGTAAIFLLVLSCTHAQSQFGGYAARPFGLAAGAADGAVFAQPDEVGTSARWTINGFCGTFCQRSVQEGGGRRERCNRMCRRHVQDEFDIALHRLG